MNAPTLLRLAIAAALLLPGVALGGETLYHNGEIFTGEGDGPSATWFLVRDGEIAAVGVELPEALSEVENRVDLGGAFVAPGFVDAQVHFVEGGLGLVQTDLAGVSGVEELEGALRAAADRPVGGWILARGLALSQEVGIDALRDALADAGPAYVALAGGHGAFVNAAGLAELGIGAGAPDPAGGRIDRGPDGAPTGLLEGEAAWSARRRIFASFSPGLVARALLRAQRRALAYGITAIGDDTFLPVHAMQYQRLASAGHFHLRVAARSFGPEPGTRFLMAPLQGRIRYLGEKHFMDGSLSLPARSAGPLPGPAPLLGQAEAEEALLFAARAGTSFHALGREGVERLVAARLAVGARRPAGTVDVITPCDACGGDLPARIRAAGYRVTAIPSRLYELPALEGAHGGEAAEHLLPLRALHDAGLEPALASGWPHGLSPETARSAWGGGSIAARRKALRMALSPLAQLAVAASGRGPGGQVIPGAASRTIPVAAALRGITSAGADALGWGELGRIRAGSPANFVILDRSPFAVDPSELHALEVEATFIDGIPVYRRSDTREGRAMREALARAEAEARRASGEPEAGLEEALLEREAEALAAEDAASDAVDEAIADLFDTKPHSWTRAPILGYDPSVGVLLGGAIFVHPFEDEGWRGGGWALYALEQTTYQVVADVQRRKAFGELAAHVALRLETWRSRFFGVGNDTTVGGSFEMRPTLAEVRPGLRLPLGRRWEAGVYAAFAWLEDGREELILAGEGDHRGVVGGTYWGPRLELVWDTRDNGFSSRKGTLLSAWTNGWVEQGGRYLPRFTLGGAVSHFVPLRAPDWILALRLEGGANFGDRGYLSDFALGGPARLRGYSTNRFRGDHAVDGTAELRFPIWRFVSGAAFADAGRVWVDGMPEGDRPLSFSGGGGLRFGVPPVGLVKLRLDAGFGRDEWGLFFTFGEAF
ncbi:MAG TPA: amidohydrolase family protein [Vulgatibacter sp.]|nr:amidohydrolase family protein [Vulgatibacter sp.]